jgi:hypothetical protein
MAWKVQVSRKFQFNAAAAVSPAEVAALTVKYKQLQQRMEARLRGGLVELRQRSEAAARHIASLHGRAQELVVLVAQAQMDLEVIPADN